MRSKCILTALAVIGLIAGIVIVIISYETPPTPPIPFRPAVPSFKHFVAGDGLVEASSENIEIGTPSVAMNTSNGSIQH